MSNGLFRIITATLLLSVFSNVHADNINVAVASNFTHALSALADDFTAKTGHQLRVSSASTGKLYTQINHGAPFDVFLSADEARADLLISEGKATAEQSRVYAKGKLVFVSNFKPEKNCQDVLNNANLKRLAIANPKTAPYGAAAQKTLEKLQLWNNVKARLVMGENVAQTLQFVSTGSANAGFIPKSMLINGDNYTAACEWDVPVDMHDPIKQKMVVLKNSSGKPAVEAFWQYMQSEGASKIIKDNGYDVL